MPKILRIVNRFNLGGPAYSIAYLTKYLDSKFEIKLIGGKRDDFEESSEFILEMLDVEYTVLENMKRSINIRRDLRSYKEIKNIIAEFKPDIVHTHAAKAGAIGRLAAHRMNVPVVVHTFHGHVFHSYFGKLKTSFYKRLERYLAKKSSGIITLSKAQHNEICNLHSICPENKAFIVPLGLNLDRFQQDNASKRSEFRQEWSIDEDTILIGIVGRVVPIKNHVFFLEAMKRLKSQTEKRVIGMIVGDGDMTEEMINRSKEMGLSVSCPKENVDKPDVIFTSWITSIDKVNASLDIMCLTSLNEGTPVSLIEAQACSLPIVSTNVGGVEDIVIDGVSGHLVDNQDIDQFVGHLIELVESKAKRESMGAAGKKHVFDKHHYTQACQRMEKIYLQLLNAK